LIVKLGTGSVCLQRSSRADALISNSLENPVGNSSNGASKGNIIKPLMTGISSPLPQEDHAVSGVNPNKLRSNLLQHDVSEMTGDDDVSVTSMSSFSVRSHGSLRHPNYHESLLHVPFSEMPRVMYMPGVAVTNWRNQVSADSNSLERSIVTSESDITSTGPSSQHQSLSSDVTILNATLVDDPEEHYTSQCHNNPQNHREVNNAQTFPLAVATKESIKGPLNCRDRRVQIIFLIPLLLLIGLAVALVISITRSQHPHTGEAGNTILSDFPDSTDGLFKGGPSINIWNELKKSLSEYNSTLTGPIIDNEYMETCEIFDNNPYMTAAESTCLQFNECRFKFCLPDLNAGSNLPTFVANVRSEKAIEVAILFASENNVTISIKTTGWSFKGSSTAYGSLMVLMNTFPKDGTILNKYKNSCGSSFPAAVAVGGGEWVDDVLEEVGDQYFTAFVPFTRALGVAGGFLQGGGVSLTSRTYGLAIDQVIDFRVTLANGKTVLADQCSNHELFWALKGGGGGTFGVVTKVHYKLEPKTSFISLHFSFFGGDVAHAQGDGEDYTKAIKEWLRFWIEKSPHLDHRWSGVFSSTYCYLFFFGPRDDATFIDEFNDWFNNDLNQLYLSSSKWGASLPKIEYHSSWYQYRGGSSAFRNPYSILESYIPNLWSVSSRLMEYDEVVNAPEDTLRFLMELSFTGTTWNSPNFLLGGKVSEVSVNDSSIHPMMRRSLWAIYIFESEGQKVLKKHFKSKENACLFNFHSVAEQNWKEVQWGSNYQRLNYIKNKYDPDGVFDCYHCVGYNGDEIPDQYFT